MPNPLSTVAARSRPVFRGVGRVGLYVGREIVGLARDFWKDGDWSKPVLEDELGQPIATASTPASPRATAKNNKNNSIDAAPDAANQWHALPGEISEKLWGQGSVTPGDVYISDALIRPLGINKDMSLLDLSAGLGARLRKTADEYKVYITGLEPDPQIAARGMEISRGMGLGKKAAIAAYDPMTLSVERKYDCIVARETIYRVADQKQFIALIIDCCKPKAQVSFTDYIVNPEARDQPAIAAWRAFEKGANPVGLVEMAESWAQAGIALRVHEDMTDYYKKEVKAGLVRFVKFMSSGVAPDAETKKAIEKRIMTWAHRMAAMEQGMKFYRFYGLR